MTILREVKKIDEYLLGKMDLESSLLFEAQMALDSSLAIRVNYQRRLYKLIRLTGRREMKSDVERIYRHLFNDASKAEFRKKILKLFSNA